MKGKWENGGRERGGRGIVKEVEEEGEGGELGGGGEESGRVGQEVEKV